ncbi:MAG: HAD hydrolase family protein [Elusimicrobiota bacterium]
MKKSVLTKLKNIKMIVFDIDGVLTDGTVIVLNSREEIKPMNVKDRYVFSLVRRHVPELKFSWISGRNSEHVVVNAAQMKIAYLYQACGDKLAAVTEICEKSGLTLDNIMCVGDDLIDIPVLKRAAVAMCPADAVRDVKDIVDIIGETNGGRGVAREAIELVLRTQKKWDRILCNFTK